MRKFAIVIGHSKDAPGAKATDPLKLNEYQYNSELAQIIYRYAMEFGLTTKIFTRDGIGIEGCYAQVNEWIKDATPGCVVELHFNSFDGKVRGTETLWDKNPPENVEYARELHESICSIFNRKAKQDRGLKLLTEEDRGHRNMAACKGISCLVEAFFGDNPQDAKLGADFKFAYGRAIAMATVRFMDAHAKRMEHELNPGLH